MSTTVPAPPPPDWSPALDAYEALAPFYDRFTADYDHETWLGVLEALAREHGLGGRRLLDAACGTGKSFLPMGRRGYEVTACDLSPSMVERARAKLGGAPERAFVADLRALPAIGPFDLVTVLDDAVNYLLTEEDLCAAFASVERVLAADGLLLFDANALRTYREAFASTFAVETVDAFFCWVGEAEPDVGPGALCAATIEVFAGRGGGCWRRTTSRHLQRHHERAVIERALAAAGLERIAVRGQRSGGLLTDRLDEAEQSKVVYVARKAAAQRGREGEEV